MGSIVENMQYLSCSRSLGLRLSQHVPHSLLGDIRIPRSIKATIAELRPTAIFTTTTSSLAHDSLQVTALRADPATNEVDGILAQSGVEGVTGTRVCESLNNQGNLVIKR
jgi:hypothetical protein